MEIKTLYIANDGTAFDDQIRCKLHEVEMSLRKLPLDKALDVIRTIAVTYRCSCRDQQELINLCKDNIKTIQRDRKKMPRKEYLVKIGEAYIAYARHIGLMDESIRNLKLVKKTIVRIIEADRAKRIKSVKDRKGNR